MAEARILIYDIEVAPNLAYTWGKWQVDVLKFSAEWFLLCFAYKFLGDDEVKVVALPDFRKEYKTDPTNDFKVVEKLHELFCLADVIVAHNGNSYDQKRSNARFLVHGLDPPTPYKQVDTCRNARKYFSFNSNSLGDLGETLGLGTKGETHGFKTWLGCMAGDKDAWQIMTSYNARDVELLEQVYLKMLPWIDNHPNIAFLNGDLENACPKCGTRDSLTRQGYKQNKSTTMQQWKCSACGGWCSSRVSEKVPQPSLVN